MTNATPLNERLSYILFSLAFGMTAAYCVVAPMDYFGLFSLVARFIGEQYIYLLFGITAALITFEILSLQLVYLDVVQYRVRVVRASMILLLTLAGLHFTVPEAYYLKGWGYLVQGALMLTNIGLVILFWDKAAKYLKSKTLRQN